MGGRGPLALGLLVSLVVAVPFGYLVHTDPRFPGGLAGGLIGAVGFAVIVSSLVYVPFRRWAWLRARFPPSTLGSLFSLHVYAGALGALLGLLHAAHAFRSLMGIALVVSLAATVATGYVGRNLVNRIDLAVRGGRSDLALLGERLDARRSGEASPLHRAELVGIAVAIADTEDAIRREEILRRALGGWRILHVAAASVFCLLLVAHIWGAFRFGLRWIR